VEYVALFIWLSLCLLLGGFIHYAMAGALDHRLVMLLAAPGLIIRKFTMTLTALVCGATVTRVGLYDLHRREIDFRAEGAANVARVMVPLAPLLGAALALIAANAAFGSPLRLDYSPPALASLDAGSVLGFLKGTWALLSSIARQAVRADWRSFGLYGLFAIIFGLALGASSPMVRVRDSICGAALLTALLLLLSSLATRRAGMTVRQAGWFSALRTFVVGCSGVAFVMMAYGLLAAIVVGFAVRVYELVTGASPPGSGRKAAPAAKRERKRAA
jgi:hypothetical protein